MRDRPVREAPDTVARPLDWQADGLCTQPGVNGDEFFDDPVTARKTCKTCPVLDTCRSWILTVESGLRHDRRGGIVAGLSAKEREGLDPKFRKPTTIPDSEEN
ncbi:WhiB family transcriptional regulator [Streptomyces sp. NPDC090306]|uniref:WhiB family transcriptional regulator n=1 Tax=Streptomyces sp. NPDC090306 TaxID=3365961 RepID=UPI00381B4BE9